MRRSWAAALVAAVAGDGARRARDAAAHGLVGRADLPIPAWLFGWAAAVVLIVSFAGARHCCGRRPSSRATRASARSPRASRSRSINPATEVFAGLVGVALLGVTIWAGLAGVQSPQANFAPTFIYVIFWVGLVVLSILFGDVFRPSTRGARSRGPPACDRVARVRADAGAVHLPGRLGHWPAAAGLLGFAWMELAYRNGDDPSTLAIAALVYSAITLLAIACFGTETWIRAARRSRSTSTSSRGSRRWP